MFFDPGEDGEPLLFSHLSWIFFTGCHTILVIGAVAASSRRSCRRSRESRSSATRPPRGSVVAIAVLGVLAWMQNMYAAPIPDGFAFMAMAAAVGLLVPIGLLFVIWAATMWDGAVSMRAPLVLALAGAMALIFGLGGEPPRPVIPVGLQLENTTAAQQDTIMVVVGFTLVAFAALHYWLPKISGRSVAEGPAKRGRGVDPGRRHRLRHRDVLRRPRGAAGRRLPLLRRGRRLGREPDRVPGRVRADDRRPGGAGNLARSYTAGRPVGHDPWLGSTLEWFVLSPPPPHNFDAVPDVRSPEPMRDIREAVREREAAYVPPEPLARSAPPPPGRRARIGAGGPARAR